MKGVMRMTKPVLSKLLFFLTACQPGAGSWRRPLLTTA